MRGFNGHAVTNLGFGNLTLGDASSEDPTSQVPKKGKKSTQDASPPNSPHAPSSVYARSWRPEQQVPSYQPLNVPPLGSNQSPQTPSKDSPSSILPVGLLPPATYASEELAALRPAPALGALTQQPEKSLPRHSPAPPGLIDELHCDCVHQSQENAPPTPELQEPSFSFRARNSVPLVEPAPQPLGRWFGSAPPSQAKLHSPKLRSPRPESTVKPPPTPVPDPSYIAQTAIPAMRLPFPQPLLLVLDLNGTLLYRPKASSHHKPRPALRPFLMHCISNYKVLIWSSASLHNVTAICSNIFTPEERKVLLGEWARDTLGLSPQQYAAKVQVYKRLDRIWNTDGIQSAHPHFANGGRWSQKNTLLLDDSVLKASAQPYNAVIVPEFVKEGDKEGTEVLGQVVAYLKMAATYGDVSSFVRKQPFHVNESWASFGGSKENGTTAVKSGRTCPALDRMMTKEQAGKDR
ncbi:MAG: hypothetical protein LQ345_002423 [Seirophora villosa]|nr:MAG: hypothetical protein LQ345_002423 [Seirophora villosa]